MQKLYYYGCKNDNTDFGAVPVKGILWGEDSEDGRYFRTLVYARRLSKEETTRCKLDFIRCESDSTVTLDLSKPQTLFGDAKPIYEVGSSQDTALASQKATESV